MISGVGEPTAIHGSLMSSLYVAVTIREENFKHALQTTRMEILNYMCRQKRLSLQELFHRVSPGFFQTLVLRQCAEIMKS